MKPYWKTPSHIIAVLILAVSHLGLIVTFFAVIGIGVNARNSGATDWKPSQEQIHAVLILFTIAVIALIYFLTDLGLFISQRKQEQKRRSGNMDDLDYSRKGSAQNKEEKPSRTDGKSAKDAPLASIPFGEHAFSYFSILRGHMRNALGLFLTVTVLLFAVIAAIVTYSIIGVEPFVLVMLYIALGLAAVGIITVLVTPLLIKKRLQSSKWGTRIYEDHMETYDSTTNVKVTYDQIYAGYDCQDSVVFCVRTNGRKMLFLISKTQELSPETLSFLLKKIPEKK